MKKDFFGGRETEETETILSFCGELRCLLPGACEGCRRPSVDNLAVNEAVGDVLSSLVDQVATAAEGAVETKNALPLAADWGYTAENGPHTWHRHFPVATAGRFQSPIDLCEADVKRGPVAPLPPIATCFQSATGLTVENTGASWQINWPLEDDAGQLAAVLCLLRGGPLPLDAEYRLLQMHAHWGAVPGRGSEHTLEGRSFDAELHLVFYNARYRPEEAMEAPDGLAVIGMLLMQQDDGEPGSMHPELEKITRRLAAVKTRGRSAALEAVLNPEALLPPADRRAYYTYRGSLTAPPLYESVTWIVMREPVVVSGSQLDMMRGMLAGSEEDSCQLADNFRPTCCLGRRSLRCGN